MLVFLVDGGREMRSYALDVEMIRGNRYTIMRKCVHRRLGADDIVYQKGVGIK